MRHVKRCQRIRVPANSVPGLTHVDVICATSRPDTLLSTMPACGKKTLNVLPTLRRRLRGGMPRARIRCDTCTNSAPKNSTVQA